MKFRIILYLVFLLPFISCSKQNSDSNKEGESIYFSISQFLDDQWDLLNGQPYTLRKKIVINGNVDTGVQHLDSVFFSHIREIFDKSDISNPKFESKYNVEHIQESMFHTLNFTAQDEDLYTQLLVVNMDYENNRVLNIYIETKQETLFHDKITKLTYAPLRFIQIIEKEKSFLSSPKNIEINYVF